MIALGPLALGGLGGVIVGPGLYLAFTEDGHKLIKIDHLDETQQNLIGELSHEQSDRAVLDRRNVPTSSVAYQALRHQIHHIRTALVSVNHEIATLTPESGSFLPGVASWWLGAALVIGAGTNIVKRRLEPFNISSRLTR
jgi:hypothetical protein